MPVLERSTILSGLLLFGAVAGAQAQPEPKESKATVTGRVTVDGKPKTGIEVVARPSSEAGLTNMGGSTSRRMSR